MQGLYEEIQQIPQRAQACLEANHGTQLPQGVPYVGMGSSYYAPLTLYYCGKDINPQIASEYYYYLASEKQPSGVLLSQSGESSETVWNIDNFEQIVAITNNPDSSLAKASNASQVIQLHSGDESYSSTKSYVNTLIALYLGLGIDPSSAVNELSRRFQELEQQAKNEAGQIIQYLGSHTVKGLYVIGSGPNYGTALEAALTLGETTKLSWIGMPAAQYDHGPKETADDSVVVLLDTQGKDQKRVSALTETLSHNSNALVLRLEENTPEQLSPIPLITRLNLIMNYLADGLQVGDTFKLGGKVTTVDQSLK